MSFPENVRPSKISRPIAKLAQPRQQLGRQQPLTNQEARTKTQSRPSNQKQQTGFSTRAPSNGPSRKAVVREHYSDQFNLVEQAKELQIKVNDLVDRFQITLNDLQKPPTSMT